MERSTAERGHDPVIGRLLDGRYLVGERVARGGMATVYAATDTRLDRTVAVKVMHANLGEEFGRRFRREAQAAARLSHHNVVSVFDQGDDEGTPFLVMELIPGITMRDLIRTETPMSPERVLTVMEPVLAALQAAHSAGMIHRDVKPENVLIADDGRIKVADFGLARAVNSDTQHTNTGVLIGTVSYLSPELVVDGKSDARADVYAAGVMIYELLTGQKPHQASSPIQVAYKHVHEDIPPPSAVISTIPDYVDALLARATARDAALRPADAGVLLHLVRRVRSALADGVGSDPGLAEDLRPHPVRDPFGDTADQLPRQIIDPSETMVDSVPPIGEPVAASPDPVPSGSRRRVDDFPVGGYDVYDQEAEPTSSFRPRPLAGPTDYRGHPGTAAAVPSAGPVSPDPAGGPWHDGTPPDDPGSPGAGRSGDGPPAYRPPRSARPSRRGPVALIAVVVTALIAGLGGWYLGFARYTNTPAVLNLAEAAARTKVQQADLTFKVTKTGYSETVPRGSVLSTSPEPGERIAKQGTVTVVISRGPERHAVPDLAGATLDAAQDRLAKSKLTQGQITRRYSPTVPKDQIVESEPATGTKLRRDAAVDLVVSKGRRPIEVPDFTGKSADAAEKALKKLGFTVTRGTSKFDDDVDKGDVISQDPDDGTLFRRQTVTLVVSKGPNLVQVPTVTAMGVEDARKRLTDAGFTVTTRRSSTYIGLKYVLRTDPKGGSKAPRGSTITLFLV